MDMLATECANYQVNIQLRQQVSDIRQLNQADAEQGRKGRFALLANGTTWYCDALVIATGGLSMPGLGATPFGYQVAEQFGIKVLPPRASLVPFTWREADKVYTTLSGVALPIVVTANCGKSFSNQMLFTHRGISGPAILQISNYWQPNESVEINLLPHQDIAEFLQQLRTTSPKLQLKNALARVLPKN